ncbi:probable enoyl-CoA hydratase [Bradysia coprophila]|uniref:probable enoyl-CoA hydratase n=1 Tax=Bradysia coprophila TaxID=38358 RepID=UPI00187D8DFE|nr:probable enoyl-CoA hydratase [Bradysia coprophila]
MRLCLRSVKMFQRSSKVLHSICRGRPILKQIRCKSSTENEPNSTGDKTIPNGTNSSNDKEDSVLVERYGSLTIIGLNRTQKRNAINQEMAFKICEAITNFENDDTSPVGIIHGVGGSFSSGYDIGDLQSETIKLENLMSSEGSVGPTRRLIKKPMVCAISGFCIANGLELALMCDLRVVEDDAILGFFNRRFGIPLMDGGTVRLPAMIGLSRALDLVLTGKMVPAKEAFEIGLANRIVAPGTALGQSINLANCLAKFPQASLNHDRNGIYTSAFETKSLDTSCMNEIMTLTNDVVNEMKFGAAQFKSGIGRGGKSSNIKERTLADWEMDEIKRERESQNIRDDQPDKT